jgi:hypothetical protein
MAFDNDFARHVDQIKLRLPHVFGKEATKQSLIIPLFQILGYDVWNPLEVQPEYGSDFSKGIKKGQVEKVDYAIKINNEPVIFVECKTPNVELNIHDGQLARYFNATPSVRVGVLTNGIRIKVFTDLQQPNIMDDKPWMDFDLRSAKQAEIDALKKLRKTEFSADQVIGLAEEMLYYNVLVPFISSQLIDPSDKLVRLFAEEIPSIKRIDRKVVDRLTPISRKAIQSAIIDHVARSFNAPVPIETIQSEKIETKPSIKKFNHLAPPNLQHTRCKGTFGSTSFRKWNDLIKIAHIQSFAKAKSFEVLQKVTKSSIRKGDHSGDSGYYFSPEIDISISRVDANRAWECALHLAVYLNTPLKVTIEWLNNKKAAFPNQTGTLEWNP